MTGSRTCLAIAVEGIVGNDSAAVEVDALHESMRECPVHHGLFQTESERIKEYGLVTSKEKYAE